MQTKVLEPPFNRFIGVQPAEPPHVFRFPAAAQYLNHLGTVHASAQVALAEASSGEFLLRVFGAADRVVPVVRRLEAKFRKPAKGAITSTVTTPVVTLNPGRAELVNTAVPSSASASKSMTSPAPTLVPPPSNGFFACYEHTKNL